MPNCAPAAIDLSATNLDQLIDLSADGLGRMFNPAEQIFSYKWVRTPDGGRNEGRSKRYTIMSLLGLERLQAAGRKSPIDASQTLKALYHDLNSTDNLGDLGLMLWAYAMISPQELEQKFHEIEIAALPRFDGLRERRTMELAWFVTGLAYARMASGRELPGLTRLAVQTFELLKQNQGRHGFFGHQATHGSVTAMVRGRIGSFADQVYPIYALSKLGSVLEIREAVEAARRCAEAICKVQGPLGQWWWHYDAVTGRVVEQYPVYSVHQDGMAPMALFAVTEAGGADFTDQILRGLSWIHGQNELGHDMCDRSLKMIWRNIHRHHKPAMYTAEVANFLRQDNSSARPGGLRVLFECRSYHLGWLLYAFAGRKRLGLNAPCDSIRRGNA